MQELFPFKTYFADAPGTLFAGVDYEADLEKARGCWRHLRTMFQELEECRAFELLKVSSRLFLCVLLNELRLWIACASVLILCNRLPERVSCLS